MLVKAERHGPQVLPFSLNTLAAFGEAAAWRAARGIAVGCARTIARFMTALHETRRHEAARALAHHRHLIESAWHASLDRPERAP